MANFQCYLVMGGTIKKVTYFYGIHHYCLITRSASYIANLVTCTQHFVVINYWQLKRVETACNLTNSARKGRSYMFFLCITAQSNHSDHQVISIISDYKFLVIPITSNTDSTHNSLFKTLQPFLFRLTKIGNKFAMNHYDSNYS